VQPSTSKAALLERIRTVFRDRVCLATVAKGETLYWEAAEGRFVYGIETGIAKLVRVGFHGKEWIVALAGPGEMLALSDVLDRRRHRSSAVAMTPIAAWKFSAAAFRDEMERDPALAGSVAAWLVHHVHDLETSLEMFSNGRAEERIANLLSRHSVACPEDADDCRSLPFRLTRKDMSEMVGTTPETCSRALSDLKRTGVLREGRDHRLHVRLTALRAYLNGIDGRAAPR
jgi:CRP-like cAMP-binding protein